MSLATRCPHCGTTFKLVRDQLLLHRGWARCGRCGEAFNAADHRFELAPTPAPQPAAVAEPAPAETLAEPMHKTPLPSAAGALAPYPNHPAQDLTPAAVGSSGTQPDPVATQSNVVRETSEAPPVQIPAQAPKTDAGPKSLWQTGAFAYAPPKPVTGVAADAARNPARAAVVPASLEATPPVQQPDAAATHAGGLEDSDGFPDDPAPLPPGAEAFDLAISLDAMLPAGIPELRQAQPAPPARSDLPQPDSLDIDLATFSSEAEAALRGDDVGSAMDEPARIEAELVRAALEDAWLADAESHGGTADPAWTEEAIEADPTAETLARPLPTAKTARDTVEAAAPASPQVEKHAQEESDSEFDLGAVLHYQFESEPQDSAANPLETAAATPRRGKEPRLALPLHGHDAAIETDAEATTLPEPQFLRQARTQERWQRPAVRAVLGLCAVLLLALGVLQAAWTWRNALASQWPQTRPALTQLCRLAGCTLAAPRRPQDLVIDTSTMSPATDGHLQLTATLRNRSSEAVAYPALELTLTGQQEQIVVRKVIEPAQYLALGTRAARAGAIQQRVLRGLAPGAELNIRLDLDLNAGQASGYTLYAFYP